MCAGSHLDTQPDGGAYDGALGVVSALEAAASVLESEAGRRHPLAVVAFVDEEGARFRTPTFASLAITGGLDIDHVLEVMGDAPAIYGVTRDSLAGSREQLERVRCFLEVHVEQGRSLADRDLALGIADVLAPRQRWRVEFEGEANHAGTTRWRTGATRCCRPPGSCWRSTRPPAPAPAPSAPSAGSRCIPGRRTRSPAWSPSRSTSARWTWTTVDEMVDELRSTFPDAAFSLESRNEGAAFDAGLREMLRDSAAARGLPAGDLPSYAGHDAGILAPHVPSAMLFVRNPTGASHTPAESASESDCLAGVQVLTDAVAAALPAE